MSSESTTKSSLHSNTTTVTTTSTNSSKLNNKGFQSNLACSKAQALAFAAATELLWLLNYRSGSVEKKKFFDRDLFDNLNDLDKRSIKQSYARDPRRDE